MNKKRFKILIFLSLFIIFFCWFIYPPDFLYAKRLIGDYPPSSFVFKGITTMRSGSNTPAVYWRMTEDEFDKYKVNLEKINHNKWKIREYNSSNERSPFFYEILTKEIPEGINVKVTYWEKIGGKYTKHMCYDHFNQIFVVFTGYGGSYFENSSAGSGS